MSLRLFSFTKLALLIACGAVTIDSFAARRPRTASPVLATPGSGLKASEIEAVYLLLDYEYGLGGAVTPTSNPYLLLKDGRIYRDPSVPPGDLDIAKSRAMEPKKWGTWTKEGKHLIATWADGKTSKWDTLPQALPATAGQTLSGSFKSVGGGGNTALGGSAAVIAVNGITFTANGRFSLNSFRSASSSEAGVSSTTTARSDRRGSYKLEGYAIELTFDDGRVQRAFFCFFPDKTDYFQLGTSSYTPLKIK